MKKFIVMCMLAVLGTAASAQNNQGQSAFGFNVGYGFSDNSNMLFALDYRYCLTDEIRFAPSLTYFVEDESLSAWAIDVNAHYLFQVNEMFGLYPLAGLDLSFWRYGDIDGGHGLHKTFTRFGVNLGAGGEVYATDQLTVGLEFKYNLIKDFNQPILAVRVGYSF